VVIPINDLKTIAYTHAHSIPILHTAYNIHIIITLPSLSKNYNGLKINLQKEIPYSWKFSWDFIFGNFGNFRNFPKFFYKMVL